MTGPANENTPPHHTHHHELRVTRFIAAPPETVWQAMAYRQEEWWCPAPWSVRIDEQDARAGGITRMTMLGPQGEEVPQDGLFLAWDEGRRFATTDAVTGDLRPSGPFMIGIWEIAPEGEGTRYTATARHWREEDCRAHADMGFEQGWMLAADQLAALCEPPAR
ncbi:SRPBCC domain-containing protein [Novosphingobium sp. 1949]|uniref:SRPBCC domain-containing protein n=1 Tax=Novosphingobium organovorum TaxID=2930092 RepID=A0ABT0B8D8_9SPHN|nr:SRPBCC domain-containing protein [Novosphingobium organovorum]MCJ2181253.1 SRPBCC domain-containing protein [Novosphingobium organovorum]